IKRTNRFLLTALLCRLLLLLLFFLHLPLLLLLSFTIKLALVVFVHECLGIIVVLELLVERLRVSIDMSLYILVLGEHSDDLPSGHCIPLVRFLLAVGELDSGWLGRFDVLLCLIASLELLVHRLRECVNLLLGECPLLIHSPMEAMRDAVELEASRHLK
ncbi:hypothetical protein PENTCL1PPCAC_5632, partial [Pristionchus entomophagus]